jgi:hypothetical protein
MKAVRLRRAGATLALAASSLVFAATAAGLPAEPAGGASDPHMQIDAERQGREQRDASARRGTPEAHAERRESRTAHSGVGPDASRTLVRRHFAEWLLTPPLGQLPPGARIERYHSDRTAVVVDADDRRLLLESSAPIRVRDRDGEERPVELELVEDAGWLRPAASPAPVAIGKRLADGFTLEQADVRVTPLGSAPESRALELAPGRVMYHNAAADSDVIVAATLRGAETFVQVRSERSPEAFELAVALPRHATLESVPDTLRDRPGAEVRRGDERLVAISAPVARDGDGVDVPVEMHVRDDRLVLEVPHRDRDVRYPIMVDPEFVENFNFQSGSGAERWQHLQNDCCSRFSGSLTNWFWGSGLYQNSDTGWYNGGEWGEMRWPTVRSTAIRRAEFMDLHHVHANTCARAYLWDPEYGVPDFEQVCDRSYDDGYHEVVVPSGNEWQQVGNYAVHNLWMNGASNRGDAWMFMGWSKIYVLDFELPSVTKASDSLSGGWHTTGVSSTPSVQGRDPGIGVKQLALYVNGALAAAPQHPCSGANGSCPEYWDASPATYSTTNLNEGANTLSAHAWDALWQQSAASTWTVNVDKTAPEILSYPGAVRPGAALASGTHAFTISARDIGANGAANSGVKRFEYSVEGASAASASTSCGSGSCSHTFQVNTTSTGLREGRHSIAPKITDGVNKTDADSFDVIVDRSVPSVTEASGSLVDQRFHRDDTYELTVSATDGSSSSREGERSGLKSFELLIDGASKAIQSWDCTTSCARTHTFRIPLTAANGIREGSQEVRLVVRDQAGNRAPDRVWNIVVDRSQPTLQVTGTLKTMAGQELPPGSYSVRAQAQDGSSASPADVRSGVTSIAMYLDGELVDSVDQTCDAGSCSLTRDWTFNTSDFSGGEHTLEVRAYDQVGYVRTDATTFSTSCCFKSAALWGSWSTLDEVYFGDADGDGASDLVGRDRATGAVRVGRSTGTSFGSGSAWGTWAPTNSLILEDVTGDGRSDLVGLDSLSGDVLVGRSTGTSFQVPVRWTTMGGREIRIADVDGDGKGDLVGYGSANQDVAVALSTGSAFGPSTIWATIWRSYRLAFADADGDGAADLIGRHSDTGELVVGVSRYSSFAPNAAWGTAATSYQWRVGDLDGDLTADVAGWHESSGDVAAAPSTESSFEPLTRWGSWAGGRSFELADVDGDGRADVVGRETLGNGIWVSRSDAVTPYRPSEDWVAPPDLVEEDGEPAAELAVHRSRMRLASQDDRRLLYRSGLVAHGEDPFGAQEESAKASIKTIYRRLRQMGVSAIRFNVYWGRHENRDGTFSWGKLDKAVALARENQMLVYLNLSGVAEPWECDRSYNLEGRACPATSGGDAVPTGISPDPAQYANFVEEAVKQYKHSVRRYSLWNEPNHDMFLVGANDGVPAVEYRALYREGRAAARREDRDVMIWIGELTSHPRNGDRFTDGGEPGVTALEFLEKVTATGLRTEGVAWHPYQHGRPSLDRGIRGEYGIGKLRDIQTKLAELARQGKLMTENRNKPSLFLTEFGYLNTPRLTPAYPQKWHSEERRAARFPGALEKAHQNRAAWMLLYHAVEIPPAELGEERWDSGLFSVNGDVTGDRGYGWPATGWETNPQPRKAYCAIQRWARGKHYSIEGNEAGFTGCPRR